MGWERRGREVYLYVKYREGGKVMSRYLGRGLGAETLHMTKLVMREVLEHDRETWARVASELREHDILLDTAGSAVSATTDVCLFAAGYHHVKGQWRRRRTASSDRCLEGIKVYDMYQCGTGIEESWETAFSHAAQPYLARLGALSSALKRNSADEQARRELQMLFRSTPRLWDAPGALQREAAKKITSAIYKDESARQEVMNGMDVVRGQLGYVEADPLQRLLIDQIALIWAELQVTSIVYACMSFDTAEPKHGPYWSKRVDQLERRYTRAVESLARVRRLTGTGPLVQINVAEQQVVGNHITGR